jgi:hypothetical protein
MHILIGLVNKNNRILLECMFILSFTFFYFTLNLSINWSFAIVVSKNCLQELFVLVDPLGWNGLCEALLSAGRVSARQSLHDWEE